MKMNWRASVFLATTLISFATPFLHAQNNAVTNQTANAIPALDGTNGVPALKDLMATSSIVTNTVGIVLVKISPGLWAGKFETTQDAYQKVAGSNPSAFSGANNPVDSVTWSNAMDFCVNLTKKEMASGDLTNGFAYSLPTRVQWATLAADAKLDDAVTSLPPNHNSSTKPVGSL